jgi:hypothetical protein
VEHKLKVFENRVLRRVCIPKRWEVTGDWRKLHTVELHNLYSSPNIIRGMRLVGHRTCMSKTKIAIEF